MISHISVWKWMRWNDLTCQNSGYEVFLWTLCYTHKHTHTPRKKYTRRSTQTVCVKWENGKMNQTQTAENSLCPVQWTMCMACVSYKYKYTWEVYNVSTFWLINLLHNQTGNPSFNSGKCSERTPNGASSGLKASDYIWTYFIWRQVRIGADKWQVWYLHVLHVDIKATFMAVYVSFVDVSTWYR